VQVPLRRVSFAVRYFQDEDNYYNSYSYVPVDVVRVKFIPTVSEYARSEKQDTWYTEQELGAMKQRAVRDADRRRDELFRSSHGKNDTQTNGGGCSSKDSNDVRGLERLVYNDHNVKARTRYESLHALLQEQYHQRRWSLRYLDDSYERIRRVVMVKGESILSQEIALRLARQDEAEAEEYLERGVFSKKEPEDGDGDDDDDCDGNDHDDRGDKDTNPYASTWQQQQQRYQERTLSHTRSRSGTESSASTSEDDCCWCVDAVDVVGKSLLLHALLRPFLELRRGNAFLE